MTRRNNRGYLYLTPAQTRELEQIRIGNRMSYKLFRKWLEAPFSHVTLRNALLGKRLWKPNHEFLVKFLKQLHSPQEQPK
jgi:hypothetical protein